jgi:hypothetical protein
MMVNVAFYDVDAKLVGGVQPGEGVACAVGDRKGQHSGTARP